MKVVLAEKPSVGKAIAAVLGAKASKDGYMEGNGYVVTWAFGHLVGLAAPDHYLGHKEWKKEDLPIIPEEFVYEPQLGDPGIKKQYNTIKRLFCATETECVICATDAGREGEAIFRYIYDSFDCRKPVKRLWVSSLTDKAIKDGFDDLKDGAEYDNLYDSAKARGEADWLVGDNATRALTLAVNNDRQIYSIGRVQTPTLGMVCKRFIENRDFVPVPYYMVGLTLQSPKGVFKGMYPTQYKTEEEAKLFMGKVPQSLAVRDKKEQEVREKSPLPYDITSIQADANRKHKFKAQKTLDIVQALYEGKKVTYPRTGSRYLGEDMVGVVMSSVGNLAVLGYTQNFGECVKGINADTMNKACFDSSKLTDHHAIIPTFENVSDDVKDFPSGKSFSSEDSRKIYRMIAMQLVMALLPACVKDRVTYTFDDVDNLPLSVSGSTIKTMGWRLISEYSPDNVAEEREEEQKLPALEIGEQCSVNKKEVMRKETKRPALLTEATLLKMMESAGKLIEDDEELSKAIKDCGIGTPATRAAVIEKLFARKYIENEKNSLKPTQSGLQLYELLKDHSICNVTMTGEWERKLNLMAEGKFSKREFGGEIEEYTRSLTTELLAVQRGSIASSAVSYGNCPICGKPLRSHSTVIYCSGWKKDDESSCQFKLFTEVRGKKLTDKMVRALLSGQTTDVIKGFKKKDGTPFDAALKFDENYKLAFVLPERKELGLSCPICGKPMKESDKSYYCSGYGQEEGSCKFGFSKERGGVKINKQMLIEILSLEPTGKTYEFTSKEGKKFNAKLRYNKDEMKLEYLFEERKRESTGLKCPECGSDIIATDKGFSCCKYDYKDESTCRFNLYRIVAGKTVSVKQLAVLLEKGKTGEIEGFVSKSGKTFSARLQLENGKISLLFDK